MITNFWATFLALPHGKLHHTPCSAAGVKVGVRETVSHVPNTVAAARSAGSGLPGGGYHVALPTTVSLWQICTGFQAQGLHQSGRHLMLDYLELKKQR